MEQLHIQTPQNVEIIQQLAGIGNRIAATIIDITTVVAYIYVVGGILDLVDFGMAITYLYLLPVFLYSLLFEYFMEGQTPGKYILSIKVVKLDGSAPRLSDILLRWIFRIIDVWMFSGLVAVITVLFSSKGQRIGDMVAGTTVISLKARQREYVTIYRDLPADYQPKFNNVVTLEEDEVQTLAQVLSVLRYQHNRQAVNLLHDAANAMRQRLQVDEQRDDMAFLEAVIRDYNYFQQNKATL